MEAKEDKDIVVNSADLALRREIQARIDDDAWVEYAKTRKFNIVIRWGFGIILGLFLTSFGVTLVQFFNWAAIMSVFLIIDYFAAIRLCKNPADRNARRNLCIFEFLAVFSYSLIAPIGWFFGEPAAKLCILLYFSGALATHSSSTQRLPLVRALMLAPYYTFIPLLFTIDAVLAKPEYRDQAIYLAIVSFLGMIYFSFVFRRSIENSRRYENALLLQEIARARAENANAAKSRFISAISYDLRGPLNAIIGSARLLKNYDKDAENRDLLSVLIESGESMSYFLNEIIDSTILETGQLSIVPKTFSPQKMLNACADLWERPIGQKNLEFICDYHNNLPLLIKGDEKNIRRIINNLLSSALKNTKLGWICLRAEHIDGNFIIEINDSGLGFQKAANTELKESNNNEFGTLSEYIGLGIGLNNCAHLVKLMGGSMKIESIVNNGSRILISLPAPIIEDELSIEQFQSDNDEESSGLIDVLIADKDAHSRLALRKLIEASGANIAEAENGEIAEKLANEKQYNMIFLDAKMPKISGINVCRKIRVGKGLNSKTPIFIMSADANLLKNALGDKIGANGILSKPFGQNEIQDILEKPKLKRNPNLQ